MSPIDARRRLEILRDEESTTDVDGDENDDEDISSIFALELAHIIEYYGSETQDDAMAILKLYVEGAKSVMLGVAYAQRTKRFSTLLWDKLVDHCLSPRTSDGDGMLFGALLEAAALSGADLARLVAKIPPGMEVEGLRPRLVAAVADYRLMVDIHQAASDAAAEEQVSLLREVAHRSRRGARYNFPTFANSQYTFDDLRQGESKDAEEEEGKPTMLDRKLRPLERTERKRFTLSLPLR